MIKTLFFISIVLVFISSGYCQTSIAINDKLYKVIPALGIVGGLSGFHTADFEFGLGLNFIETRPANEKFTKPFLGFSLSTNFNPSNHDLLGENLNIWFNGLIVLGLNQNFYSDGKFSTWGLKPFIGLEFYGISFIYGYNIFLNNNEIGELSNHIFSVRYFLPIIKIKKNGL